MLRLSVMDNWYLCLGWNFWSQLGLVDEIMTAVLTETQRNTVKPLFEHGIVMNHVRVHFVVSKAAT